MRMGVNTFAFVYILSCLVWSTSQEDVSTSTTSPPTTVPCVGSTCPQNVSSTTTPADNCTEEDLCFRNDSSCASQNSSLNCSDEFDDHPTRRCPAQCKMILEAIRKEQRQIKHEMKSMNRSMEELHRMIVIYTTRVSNLETDVGGVKIKIRKAKGKYKRVLRGMKYYNGGALLLLGKKKKDKGKHPPIIIPSGVGGPHGPSFPGPLIVPPPRNPQNIWPNQGVGGNIHGPSMNLHTTHSPIGGGGSLSGWHTGRPVATTRRPFDTTGWHTTQGSVYTTSRSWKHTTSRPWHYTTQGSFPYTTPYRMSYTTRGSSYTTRRYSSSRSSTRSSSSGSSSRRSSSSRRTSG